MKRSIRVFWLFIIVSVVYPSINYAAFPDDFSDVIWLDPNISAWPQASSLTVEVSGTATFFEHSKQASWPNTNHSIVGPCCNASVWAFIKRNGQWYASTFEYLRPNTSRKFTSALDGAHIKRSPFLVGDFDWKPADGEVYGFMVSGFARFNLNDVNIQQRSNVYFYEWGSGPTSVNSAKTFNEVPRNSNGSPIDPNVQEPEPEISEECVAPAPVINNHNFTGPVTGLVEVRGFGISEDIVADGDVSIRVSDDRSLTFTLDDESFITQVNQNGSFGGVFNFDIDGQCPVTINVTGNISGRNASGIGSGFDSCTVNNIPLTINFNASFTATSVTEPNFLDQRSLVIDPCQPVIISPIINLLLDD